MGKKYRGLNICTKPLIFGILTFDTIFLERSVAIFLILIFARRSQPKLLEMAKDGKSRHFSTLEAQKWGKKSKHQKFSHKISDEPHEDATSKILGNFAVYCCLYIFSVEDFKTLLCLH